MAASPAALLDPIIHEQDLVERAKTDPDAFGELYETYVARIYRYVFSRLHDQNASEDVTAEVFMRALRGIKGYQNRGRPFVCWLYRIALNQISDYCQSRPNCLDLEAAPEIGSQEDVEDLVIRRDRIAALSNSIEGLPAAQRRAMVLRFSRDLPLAEVGRRMGKSEPAVKLLIHRAVVRLRAEFPVVGEAIGPAAASR